MAVYMSLSLFSVFLPFPTAEAKVLAVLAGRVGALSPRRLCPGGLRRVDMQLWDDFPWLGSVHLAKAQELFNSGRVRQGTEHVSWARMCTRAASGCNSLQLRPLTPSFCS